MRIRPNGKRALLLSVLAALAWLWHTDRLHLNGLFVPLRLSRMSEINRLTALALFCLTLVAIVNVLARRQ